MNQLTWLQSWFLEQCDGEWEHSYGVRVDTLDNPGWSLEIDLAGTALQDAVHVHQDYVRIGKFEHPAWDPCVNADLNVCRTALHRTLAV